MRMFRQAADIALWAAVAFLALTCLYCVASAPVKPAKVWFVR